MRHIPIKLGPLALLLTVISICMTTLGILAFTTARADLGLAEKYAATVRERYELERQGQAFLQEAAGASRDAETDENGVIWKVIEGENASLRIGLASGNPGYEIIVWRIEKGWEPQQDMGELWSGE